MKAGHKFLLGAAIIVSSVGFLITEGVKETGVYFLTPAELAAKTATDPSFVENVGFKVGAKVVPGSVRRDPGRPGHRLQGLRRDQDLSGHLPRPGAGHLYRCQ